MMEKIQYTQQTDSPLGSITMASDGEALTGLWFAGQKYFASTLGTLLQERRLPIFDEAKRWLEIYFQGRKPDFTPKLNLAARLSVARSGTFFCRFLMAPHSLIVPSAGNMPTLTD